jgi:hypothetical protein
MKRVATLRADYIYRNGTLELSRRPKRVKSRPIDKADHEQRQIERMMRQMEAIIRGTS